MRKEKGGARRGEILRISLNIIRKFWDLGM
jgi:hypothetical protein